MPKGKGVALAQATCCRQCRACQRRGVRTTVGTKLSLPWYRWFAGDWLSCETRLDMSLAERGFYRDCLDLNFTRGSLPASPELLCKLLGVSRKEFNRVSARVLSEFQPDPERPDRLTHPRIAAELQRAAKRVEMNREKGRRGGLTTQQRRGCGQAVASTPASAPAKPQLKPNSSEAEAEADVEKSTHAQALDGADVSILDRYPRSVARMQGLYKLGNSTGRKLMAAVLERCNSASDETIAKAVDVKPHQRNAGLWLQTLPENLRRAAAQEPDPTIAFLRSEKEHGP